MKARVSINKFKINDKLRSFQKLMNINWNVFHTVLPLLFTYYFGGGVTSISPKPLEILVLSSMHHNLLILTPVQSVSSSWVLRHQSYLTLLPPKGSCLLLWLRNILHNHKYSSVHSSLVYPCPFFFHGVI